MSGTLASQPPRAKVEVQLAFDQRADAAAAAVLRALLGVINGNLDGALAAEDSEFLHQLRIAVRRSRTVQRQLKTVFPVHDLPGFRSEFKWLQRVTGPARDLDVYLEGFDELRAMVPERFARDLEPLRLVLRHGRLAAHGAMARALLSLRAAELLSDWEMLLESLVELPTADRPKAEKQIGKLAGHRIRVVYKRIVRMGTRIDEHSPAADYHELRKKGKELRYMLELFAIPLHDPDVVAPLVKSLKGLQDLLGRHQDRQVQKAMLTDLADEVATMRGGPRAVMAMGVLVDRLGADELETRHEFAERFAALASDDQHARVQEAFGR
jgi:CHAD domain-containing protein